MGALLIDRELIYVALKCLLDETLLLLGCHIAQDGLDRVGALLVAADLDKVILD